MGRQENRRHEEFGQETAVSRVATVTLHMAEHFPNRSILASCVSLLHKRLALDECIKISSHEVMAGRRAWSFKCKKCMHKDYVPSRVRSAPPIPLLPVVPVSGPIRNDLDHEDAEPTPHSRRMSRMSNRTMSGYLLILRGRRDRGARLGTMSVHSGLIIFPPHRYYRLHQVRWLQQVGEPRPAS